MRLQLKQNETRGKKTDYRGWLAIASTKQVFQRDLYNINWLRYVETVIDLSKLTYGAVQCIVRLDDVISTDVINHFIESLSYHEKQWGDYTQKRHIWQTSHCIVLPKPIPVIGRQWLFDWEVPKELEYLLKEN